MNKKELYWILDQHRLWWESRGKEGEKAQLRGARLSKADLKEANLRGANLSGADLSEADLSGADLSGASFSWADLSGADLSGANLREADLWGTDLLEANLKVFSAKDCYIGQAIFSSKANKALLILLGAIDE